MSKKATAEIDFFTSSSGDNSPSDNNKQLFRRHSSFRGLQSAISKMDPQLVKSVMDSNRSTSVRCTPKTADQSTSPAPAQPALNITNSAFSSGESNFPLTIFYNGRVCVFNLPVEKAEMVLKLACQASSGNVEPKVAVPPSNQPVPQLLNTSLNGGDLPQTRRKSLGVFLERRKQRTTCISP